MSNFWAQKLGIAPAPQPVQQPQQPQQPAPALPQPWYAPQTAYQPQVPLQQAPAQPQVPQNDGQWGTVEGSMAKAKSAKSNETCPNCGSGNVFRSSPNSMLQCFNCGYNPRFEQSGGEGGLPSGDGGPATPARQLATGGANGASQFNPGHIVGRI